MSELDGNDYIPMTDFVGSPEFDELLSGQPASDIDGPDPLPEPTPDTGEADEFPESVHDDVTGLLELGALTTEVELYGHTFVLKTLKVGEDLAAAQVIKDFEGTLAQGKAYAMAQVAAAIVTVDGKVLVDSLGPDDALSTVRRKFAYIRQRWYWHVIERLYDELSVLNVRQAEAYSAFEGKGAAGRPTLMPSAGSHTSKGF